MGHLGAPCPAEVDIGRKRGAVGLKTAARKARARKSSQDFHTRNREGAQHLLIYMTAHKRRKYRFLSSTPDRLIKAGLIQVCVLEDRLRVWNPWWGQKEVPAELLGLQRDALDALIATMDARHIKDLVGVRRCGKTTLMLQLVDHLIREGIPPVQVTLVNLDDPSLRRADFDALETAIDTCAPDTSHLFLDEVQEKPGWESWVRTLYDTRRHDQIVVTGSSVAALTGDMARLLTGRHLSQNVRPFGFPEYVRAMGHGSASPEATGKERAAIRTRLDRYLTEGGMPEVVGRDAFRREQTLVTLFGDIVQRDVAARHGLSGAMASRIAATMARDATKPTSMRRLATAVGTSAETASRYADHLVESNLFLEVDYFTRKQHAPVQAARKFYLVDPGLHHAVAGGPGRGRLAEAAVHRALVELGRPWFWTEPGKADVDFVLGEPPKAELVLQVTTGMDRAAVAERERRSLDRAMEVLACRRGVIVTWNEDGVEQSPHGDVLLVPLWRFLLEPERYIR